MENEKPNYIVQRGVSIFLKHAEWIDTQGKDFNFSLFVREAIEAAMKKQGE